MNVTLSISKSDVLAEVAKTTAYEGAHTADFDNTFTKVQDQEMLKRFWDEAGVLLTEKVMPYLSSDESEDSKYQVQLCMPEGYDVNLNNSLAKAAFSHMTDYIIAKWLEVTSKDKAKTYFDSAAQSLLQVNTVLLRRNKIVSIKTSVL